MPARRSAFLNRLRQASTGFDKLSLTAKCLFRNNLFILTCSFEVGNISYGEIENLCDIQIKRNLANAN